MSGEPIEPIEPNKFDKMENNLLLNKKDFGICYCGGGLRACVLTYGNISELDDMNIMKKIKYVSGVSGATWFIVGYTYYNTKIKFDKYNEPEECVIKNINYSKTNTFGKILCEVNLATEMIESFVNFTDRKISRWNTVIYESFFEKYGETDSKYDWDNLPCPIINSSISYNGVNERLFGIEFTPIYSNIPIYYKKDNVEYGGYKIEIDKTCLNYELVPYIQSGISSAFFEAGKELYTKNKYKGINYELFNPNTNQINSANLVDGGMVDNSGIISLLARKVKNIHMNIFPNVDITNEKFIESINYFSSLFKGNPESEIYGIFKFGLWEKVYAELIDKYNKGEPLTILITTEIEPNEFFQIEAYGPIKFLFHIASRTSGWFDKLPLDTKKYIDENIETIPNISTIKFKLDYTEINLMYNLMRWDIKNSLEYKEFYSELN